MTRGEGICSLMYLWNLKAKHCASPLLMCPQMHLQSFSTFLSESCSLVYFPGFPGSWLPADLIRHWQKHWRMGRREKSGYFSPSLSVSGYSSSFFLCLFLVPDPRRQAYLGLSSHWPPAFRDSSFLLLPPFWVSQLFHEYIIISSHKNPLF